jgi:hypothetical protein
LSCANGPATIAAYLIYQSTGDSSYLTMAQTINTWQKANNYDAATGRVRESNLQNNTCYSYDSGTFAAACWYLGDTATAMKCGDWVKSNWGIQMQHFGSGADAGGFNGICMRWLGKVGYDPVFLRAVCNNAWAYRNSAGLVNQAWYQPTPDNTPLYSFDCGSLVAAMFGVTPNQPDVLPTSGFNAFAVHHYQALPASTVFTITNGVTNSLSWSLVNTSSWLTVSSSSGTLDANAATTVAVSLNASVATNLPPDFYTASIVFTSSDPIIGGFAVRTFTLDTTAVNWPVTLSGFNAAILASNNATAGAPGATAFDLPNNYCFYQQGLSGGNKGLPLNGVFSSQSDPITVFQLGPFGATNALMLGNTYPQSGTLTLNPPMALNTLAILAVSANGGGQGTFFLTFTNGVRSPVFAFNCQDWYNTVTNVAIQGFGRLKLGTSFNFEDPGGSNPNLYQTAMNLAPLGLSLPISSITFSNPASAGATTTTAILGVSGMPASLPLQPPTGLVAYPGTNATVQLVWNASPGATNYNLFQSSDSDSGYSFIGRTTETNFTVTGLANGTTYYFVISASGIINESANSAPVSAMPGSYASWALIANPVAYWPLNETSGTTAFDLVGGNNGSYNGGCQFATTGVAGAGFPSPHRIVFFNGSTAYAQAPRVIGATNFSIVFWMRTAQSGGAPNWYNGRGLVDGTVSAATNDFGLALVSSKVGFGVGNPDTTLTSVKTVNDGVWHHVVAARDSGSGAMTLYIDGKFDNTVNGPAGARTNSPALRFGSLQTGANFTSVSLSDVAMYSQALNSNQVATLYSAATGIFYNITLTNVWNGANLILSWPGNGKLLEATNLAGPWTTNASASPVTLTLGEPQKFYRIKTQ